MNGFEIENEIMYEIFISLLYQRVYYKKTEFTLNVFIIRLFAILLYAGL